MNFDDENRDSQEIAANIAAHVRQRRKEFRLTQSQLAERAGVSFASYKRFEQTGLISLSSLIKVAVALKCETDFDTLFSQRRYSSIEEVINASREA